MCACMRHAVSSVVNLCDPMNCSLPGSSDHGILQARIPEEVAMPFSRGSPRLRDRTPVSDFSYIGRWVLYHNKRHLRSPSNTSFDVTTLCLKTFDLFWAKQSSELFEKPSPGL